MFWRRRATPPIAHRSLSASNELEGQTKLHLGCGPHIISGWANIDADPADGGIKWDLREALPIADGTIEFIFAEHFIEHIDLEQAIKLLGECRRYLAPGGTLRLSTPDMAFMIGEYQGARSTEWTDMGWHPSTPCQMVNEGMRLWGHLFVYDAPELHRLLKSVGFTIVEDVAWRESRHPILRNLETRHWHHELIVEASC